ncbi:DinB family protein [Streptomyces sp. NRRL S-87]|uniref:DinB family protein n=1 Tax=Streptomyces sp. NRRL S-87 TaxID=1463920 RepID=UPI0004C0514E|nr:DinB family protein [Streptomyces sp. NRRL S-87]
MTKIERQEPSTTAAEREMLDGWLDYHRATLAAKCEGLTDEQLRRPVLAPSELTLLGLTRHMAEVERWWFQEVTLDLDLPPLYCTEEDQDGDFHVTEEHTYEEAEAARQEAIARAREIAASRSLDEPSVRRSRRTDEPYSLRWVYTHMIEEYARHNGHADLLREHLDGSTGD